jgi:hypothetical protein
VDRLNAREASPTARLVGTVVRLGARDEYRFETIVRVAQQYIDEGCGGVDR